MTFREVARSSGLLLSRVGLAAIFLYTGGHNITQLSETTAKLAAASYPKPQLLAIVAVCAELCGGLSLLLGAMTPLGCVALILFLVPTTYTFHFLDARAGNPMQTIQLLKNAGLIGGLFAVLCAGPGAFSFDRKGQP